MRLHTLNVSIQSSRKQRNLRVQRHTGKAADGNQCSAKRSGLKTHRAVFSLKLDLEEVQQDHQHRTGRNHLASSATIYSLTSGSWCCAMRTQNVKIWPAGLLLHKAGERGSSETCWRFFAGSRLHFCKWSSVYVSHTVREASVRSQTCAARQEAQRQPSNKEY